MLIRLAPPLALLLLAACTSAAPTRTAAPAAARADTPPPGCVSQTATRLPASPGDCTAFGRSYSDTDLKTTGKTEVGQALSVLDPSLTVRP